MRMVWSPFHSSVSLRWGSNSVCMGSPNKPLCRGNKFRNGDQTILIVFLLKVPVPKTINYTGKKKFRPVGLR